MRGRLSTKNFGDVRIVIINAGTSAHAGLALQAAAGSVPVLQDNPILSPSIWELMGTTKDDIMVFDRCGRLTYHVIMPWSMLTYPYVKAALLSTYHDEPCGQCNITTTSHNEEEHQNPTGGDNDLSSINSSVAEQLLLAPQLEQPSLPLSNPTASETLQGEVETSMIAPPTDNQENNAEGSPVSSDRQVIQDESKSESETATEGREEMNNPAITVIMRSPHSHLDNEGAVKRHDYLVMRTGDPSYHGHLNEEGVTPEPNKRASVNIQRNAIRRDDTPEEIVHGSHIFRGYPLWRNTWITRGSGQSNGSSRGDNLVRPRMGVKDGEVNKEEIEGSQRESVENGENAEEVESKDIRQRLIEHYRKLLPWINYVL